MQFLEKPAQLSCPIRNKMSEISHDLIKAVQKNGRMYEVGGVVRDRLLLHAKPTKDCDYLVTGIPYDDLTKILRKFGRVDLVGRSFGVIKFTQTIDDQQHIFDITLPRKEHSTGVGHKDFAVSFDPSLPVEEDLKRRDFTINAIARVIDSGELVDPLGGVKDLENRTLKMVSENSFEEDPLRMLRAVQLSARFNLKIEDKTLKSLKEHHALISSISAERIAEELNKLLIHAKKPSEGFRLMQTSGLLKYVLPQLQECVDVDQPGGYHRWDVFEHTIRTIDECRQNLRLRLAALFHDIRKPQHKEIKDDGCTFYGHEIGGAKAAKRWLRDYRYPIDLTGEVVTLVERHMFTTDVMDKGVRRLIRKVGLELIFDLLDLRRADVIAQGMGGITDDVDELEARIRQEIDKKSPFGLKDLPLKGSQLMKLLKLESGPAIGEILNHLLEQVLDFPEKNITSELESMAKDYYQENLNKLLELNRKRLKDTSNENS